MSLEGPLDVYPLTDVSLDSIVCCYTVQDKGY